jgi:hypothetical protein
VWRCVLGLWTAREAAREVSEVARQVSEVAGDVAEVARGVAEVALDLADTPPLRGGGSSVPWQLSRSEVFCGLV